MNGTVDEKGSEGIGNGISTAGRLAHDLYQFVGLVGGLKWKNRSSSEKGRNNSGEGWGANWTLIYLIESLEEDIEFWGFREELSLPGL